MNRIKEKIKHATKVVISNMVDQETREWPPKCLILAYQPVRPCRKREGEDQIANVLSASSARKD